MCSTSIKMKLVYYITRMLIRPRKYQLKFKIIKFLKIIALQFYLIISKYRFYLLIN